LTDLDEESMTKAVYTDAFGLDRYRLVEVVNGRRDDEEKRRDVTKKLLQINRDNTIHTPI
jgi:hypothetical protein